MGRTLCILLGAALLFGVASTFSLSSPGAKQAYAQATPPAPEKPAKPKISFQGGPGDTPETAVVITGAPNSVAGIAAEYQYLEQKWGRRSVGWQLQRQSIVQKENKVFDRLEIRLQDSSKKTIFFDITEFFGKL